jgi:hypothetical protein
MGGGLRLRGPDQQAADGMALVERIEQPAHLVAIPHVASLEFRQRYVGAVDVVEDGGDFHGNLIKQILESIATGPVGVGRLTTYSVPSLPTLQTQEDLHHDKLLRFF